MPKLFCKTNSIESELTAFDCLPEKLRQILNYSDMCIDPRYILGMYKTQGENNTVRYLSDIGVMPNYV